MDTAPMALTTLKPSRRAANLVAMPDGLARSAGAIVVLRRDAAPYYLEPRIVYAVRTSPVDVRLATRQRLRVWWVAALAAISGFSAASYAQHPDDGYVLRIPLAAKLPETPTTQSAPLVQRAPATPQIGQALLMPAPAALPAPQPSRPAALAIEDIDEVRAASALAFKTQVAQPWRSAGMEGYVVAGPIQFVGNGACRIVSIWAEARGTPGRSFASRRCLTKGGSWSPVVDDAATANRPNEAADAPPA